ncbi:DDT domain-containing protein DDR4 isoform X2 [Beta vulgaris subsp. vulgaris]|uniref:DDT domain-containing protein DDR4 isoform X2 n=1 Tax=Beta vulgaris subsp. vulgaris TaxID=3555 RepID=UPI002036B1D0|nr:DDT domain-containing protein DDR4 isoform X2 [Beta vulgaris subsp. vulgaris]
MESCDLLPNPTIISPKSHLLDLPAMDDVVLSPIQRSSGEIETNGVAEIPETNKNPENSENPETNKNPENSGNPGTKIEEINPIEEESKKELELGSNDVGSKSSSKNGKKESNNSSNNVIVRRERPTRACTARPAKYVDPPVIERRPRPAKREKVEKLVVEEVEDEEDEEELKEQCSKVVTSLVNPPMPEQMPRWHLRSMWEMASILNFFHVFRAVLNITVEFSAEELESALLTPNSTLGDIHIPLLKAIPPVTRMACGRDTWVTVLCRKLRDWWHWVAEGELPIVANHGAEIEMYKTLDPGVRVVILKALCDIRVEQDDIRSYIDNSLKHGGQLSGFRKERIGGDSHGISYWYEDDEFVGHRLYREIRRVERKVEMKKGKTRGSHVLPSTTYEWETVATNLDEFLDVSEKLFSSKNRTEVSLGKKLKNDMLTEIEKVHKRKEKLLKKQQRQALLLDNFATMDGLVGGRSLRDRKPVTYTFDDFDRSINEAIKVTKRKQPSPEPGVKRDVLKSEPSANGRWNGSSHPSLHGSFSPPSPVDYDEMDVDNHSEQLDRGRQRPQRYSMKEFVEAVSDNDEEYVDSDDDIVGEAVYDDEYLQQRKQKKRLTSSSEGEGDDEYHWSEENGEDEVEEEEEEDSPSGSEDSDQPRERFKKPEGRTRRGTKIRSVDDLDSGLRRSKRATRNRIDYRQYEISESETETSMKHGKSNAPSEAHYDATDNPEYSMESQDSDEGNEDEQQERGFGESIPMDLEKDEDRPPTKSESPKQDDPDGIGATRRFLDLNELAPGSGFDDGPSALVKDDDHKGE